MSVIQMDFESQYLGCRNPICVILPDVPRPADPREFYPKNRKLKVLWLLHGTFGDSLDWLRRTNIEVYACEKNLAVVMPSCMNSDYVNWTNLGIGYNAYDYLFEELMPLIYNWFPISDKREDNYIAGLSMGGYGAMVYALNRPDKFCMAASLSAPLSDPRVLLDMPEQPGMFAPVILDRHEQLPAHLQGFRKSRRDMQLENAGGAEAYLASKGNTWDKLIDGFANGVDFPELYFCCGTNDFLYDAFCDFRTFAQEHNYPILFEEAAGYKHEWRFWDKYIEKIINRYIPAPSQESLAF